MVCSNPGWYATLPISSQAKAGHSALKQTQDYDVVFIGLVCQPYIHFVWQIVISNSSLFRLMCEIQKGAEMHTSIIDQPYLKLKQVCL